jgi:hypothetical protein
MEKAEKFKPSLFIKLFIGYIYFMQGIYLSLVGMIIYIYPTFPSPDVLSAFSFVTLPFSFKYVTGILITTKRQLFRNLVSRNMVGGNFG